MEDIYKLLEQEDEEEESEKKKKLLNRIMGGAALGLGGYLAYKGYKRSKSLKSDDSSPPQDLAKKDLEDFKKRGIRRDEEGTIHYAV